MAFYLLFTVLEREREIEREREKKTTDRYLQELVIARSSVSAMSDSSRYRDARTL